MPAYSFQNIAAVIQAQALGNVDSLVQYLCIDSRNLLSPADTLFVALVGERHNGHDYLDDLYQKGVRMFLVSQKKGFDRYHNAGFLVVDNTLEAFQRLVQYHRKRFGLPVVAITGSNGKTIVKEWLAMALSSRLKVCRSPKSYNSQVGVPLSVWQVDESFDMGIFEAGISQPGEMIHLEKIIAPTYGIFTNVGQAHQEGFTSLRQKVEEKALLFRNADYIYYCSDYPLIDEVLQGPAFKRCKLIAWSTKRADGFCFIQKVEKQGNTSVISYRCKGDDSVLTIPFTDGASVENAVHVLSFLLHQGYPTAFVHERLLQLQPIAMRLELVRGMNNSILVSDVYNSDISSLRIAIDYLRIQQKGATCLILSDIEQSGIAPDEMLVQVAKLIADAAIDEVVAIGDDMGQIGTFLHQIKVMSFTTTNEFLDTIHQFQSDNKTILIKGARKFRFEKITSMLSEKKHTSVLEINLNNLISNLNYFRSLLSPGTKIMVMAKALTYGSGGFEVANVLQHQKVDYLGVAFTDEGVELRQAGIHTPILVLSPAVESFDQMVQYKLEPEIYSFSVLRSFIAAIKSAGITKFPIHIKLDTGMHRLGFMPHEIPNVLQILSNNCPLKVQSVFSHLAVSDNPNEDAFTLQQIGLLKGHYQKFCDALGYKPILHVLNSAGIERFPQAHFDMVRLGIGLHGISSVEKPLLAVSKLVTTITQVKTIPVGDTIGYNRREKATREMKIAIIPLGYADGLDRRFGNHTGQVIIDGTACKFIGDICMDMSMVDVTGLEVFEGQQVEVFGEKNSISLLAKQIGTIPYEILTNISQRVKRIYVNE